MLAPTAVALVQHCADLFAQGAIRPGFWRVRGGKHHWCATHRSVLLLCVRWYFTCICCIVPLGPRCDVYSAVLGCHLSPLLGAISLLDLTTIACKCFHACVWQRELQWLCAVSMIMCAVILCFFHDKMLPGRRMCCTLRHLGMYRTLCLHIRWIPPWGMYGTL